MTRLAFRRVRGQRRNEEAVTSLKAYRVEFIEFHYLDQFSSEIPYTWPLVPVVGKQPYQKNWVNKKCDRSEILAELQSGKATGVGLKLGNGLLAIDIDGESTAKLLLKLSGKNSLIDFFATTAWTSGRPGRRQ